MNIQERGFQHHICKHVFNRIKIWLYDEQGDEDYNLDLPEDVFIKLLQIMNEWHSGSYKPSDIFDKGEN